MSEAAAAEAVQAAFDAALSSLAESPLRTAVYNARKDFFQKKKMPGAAFFRQVNTARILPEIAQLLENLAILEKSREVKRKFFKQYDDALKANYALLQRAACDETLRRALLFASHDLLERLPAFAEKSLEKFTKKDRQTALSLLQYLTRAAAKTSPLSRFTTVSLHKIGGQADESEAPFFQKSQVTPNVALLPALYEVLLREPGFYRALSLRLNPCIENEKQKKWLYFDGEQESFQQMGKHPVADLIVRILLENGRKWSFVKLLHRLGEEVDADPTQLQSLVFELVDYGLLEWDLPEKGLSPGWCGSLYNFLGFLPEQPPVIVEAAALLQWLRTAARTLPFQPVGEAQATQREAVLAAKTFFEKYGGAIPPIAPEQIFFEDVADSAELNLPETVVQTLANDLVKCWQERDLQAMPAFRVQLFSFAEKILAEGETVDFLDFSERFLNEKKDNLANRTRLRSLPPTKIGVLTQVFRDETGAYRAVVNGLFPGGGKLMARWLQLFPAETGTALRGWSEATPFPWQGWSNANFQPAISKKIICVPDGRTAGWPGSQEILLTNLALQRKEGFLQLIDKESNEAVLLADLGLEAPETRPPVMQILWHLGVPYVSLESLLPERKWMRGTGDWHVAERVEFGSLILARKVWRLGDGLVENWLSEKTDADFFQRMRTELQTLGIFRQFFVRSIQEKPQYFDLDSPVTILLFAKILRQRKSPLILTEMLPLAHQNIIQKNGFRVAEFVLELAPRLFLILFFTLK
ncbi:MAG: hypothetical protein OHK0019_01020 [Saprospiraceae bacterium]